MRVFGTIDLPDTDIAPRLLERYVDAGGHVLDLANVYVMHQPDHVLPVVGTTSEAHVDEALASTEVRLDDAQVAWLEGG